MNSPTRLAARTGGTPGRARPQWHHVYYLLAIFNVVAILAGLYLSHHVNEIFLRSISTNKIWEHRQNEYRKLGELAAAVDAPGNNVFESQDVTVESARMRTAARAFNERLKILQAELTSSGEAVDVTEPLLAHMDAMQAEMMHATKTGELIFTALARRQNSQAAAHMAVMDRSFARANRSLAELLTGVNTIEDRLFSKQQTASASLHKAEYLMAALVFLMIGSATVYGRKLSGRMGTNAQERERYIQELQTKGSALLESDERFRRLNAGLEQRVHERTEQLEAANWKIEEAARTNSNMVEYSQDVICSIDEAGRFIEVSPACLKVWGYSPDELRGRSTMELIHPEDAAQSEQAAFAIIAGHVPAVSENRFIRKDGLVVNMLWSASWSDADKTMFCVARDITERKRAEELLRESDERFRLMVESVQDYAILALDPHGYITSWNAGAERIKGYRAEEIIGQHFSRFYPPEDIERSPPGRGLEIAKTEGRFEEEGWRVRKDGSRFWAHVTITAVRNKDGQLRGFSKVTRDITERKRAEESLQKEREFLEALLENVTDGIVACNAAGVLTLFNRATREMHGLPMTLIPAEEWAQHFNLYLPDGQTLMTKEQIPLLRALQEGTVRNAEIVIKPKQGTPRRLVVNGQAMFTTQGQKVGAVVAMHDITERKQAEEQLQESEQQLQTAQALTQVGSWEWDVVTNKVIWSNELYRIFGLTPQQFEATYEAYMGCVYPEDRERVKETVTRTLQEKGCFSYDHRIICPNGTVRLLHSRGELIVDEAGQALKMVGSAQDVTEARQDAAELEQAREAAEAASRAKSDFLANMSHEIRTPMNGVLGTLGLLLDSGLNPVQRELATLGQGSGETLLTLINDILDFSKIEAGKLTIEPIAFDLLKAVEEATSLLAPRVVEKELDLIVRYAPDVPRAVIGDPGRIRQILTNMAGNALKFTEQGHVLINIESEAHTDEEVSDEEVSLRFSIEDSGIGIPADKLSQLFEKFTQADASTTRRYGGTGLGLAISKQLVELMGGEIGAQSTWGTGSTFWFTLRLPLQKEALKSVPQPTDLENVRVLIVDDNAVNRRVLNEQIIGWKMRSGSCASGEDALKVLQQAHASGDPYRIAILDYQMPDMDGVMLAQAIKADPALRETALVLLTSGGKPGDAARLEEIGFAASLSKPARQSHLLEALLHVLSDRTPTQDIPARAEPIAAQPSVEPRFDLRVLLAEDNVTNQKIAVMMLQKLGCAVDIAADGYKAVEMVEASTYDLIFMDCEMPRLDGYKATELIRGRGDDKARLPIIAVTAQAMTGARDKCLAAGMDDYISKPVHFEDFVDALELWAPHKKDAGRRRNGEAKESDPPHQRTVDRVSEVASLDPEVMARLRELAAATDASLLNEIFESFLRDGMERLNTLKQAAQSGEAEGLRKAAHTLKGAAANVGARRVTELAHRLEELGESGTVDGSLALIEELETDFANVRAEITTALETS